MDTPLATAPGHPDPPPGQCWCCGSIEASHRMVHLGNHPEVAMCLPCARWAAKEAWEIEDRERTGALVRVRDRLRAARRGVVERGWHHSGWFGGPIRWLGKRFP